MTKVILIFLGLFLLVSAVSIAKPLSGKQHQALETQPGLRDEMGKMIISIADLDILVNRDRVVDYEIFQDDARRILDAIARIRKMDTMQVYKSFLDRLAKPTEKLLELSKNQDPKASKYPEEIFNACFKCHQAHRGF